MAKARRRLVAVTLLVLRSARAARPSYTSSWLVGGGDGHLQGLRDDVDLAGGVLEIRDIFRVVFKVDKS